MKRKVQPTQPFGSPIEMGIKPSSAGGYFSFCPVRQEILKLRGGGVVVWCIDRKVSLALSLY